MMMMTPFERYMTSMIDVCPPLSACTALMPVIREFNEVNNRRFPTVLNVHGTNASFFGPSHARILINPFRAGVVRHSELVEPGAQRV